MKVTRHAKKRFEERTNISNNEWEQNAKQAFKKGYKIGYFSDPFYSYLFNKQLEGDRTSLKIWNDNIYIFDNRHQRLLTVFPVPNEFLPINKYLNTNNSPCMILVNDSWYVPIKFKSIQSANNYIKNNRNLIGLKTTIIKKED